MGAVISFHAVRCTLSLRLRPSEKEIPGSGCNSCPGIASIGPPSFRSGSLYSQRMAGPGTCTALVLGMLACLYVSLWFYARHLPERWFPGRFDIIGNSHQVSTGIDMLSFLLALPAAEVDWNAVPMLVALHHGR